MDKYSGTDNLEIMTYAKNYNDFLINLIKINTKKEEKILDFGAGLGYYSKKLSDEGFDISCLEPDVSQSNKIEELGLLTFKFLSQIENESLDFIYSLNVLEHIKDDLGILNELKKKLKKNGKILIYVPAFNILYSSMDKKVGHFRRYTSSSLNTLALNSELNVIKIKYVDFLGFFVSLLYKIIGDKNGNISKGSVLFFDKYIFPPSKILDKIFNKIMGKNVYIILSK